MTKLCRRIVVLGGGTAGWLTAGLVAATHHGGLQGLQVTVIESDQIAPIGVGEGTWPSMRDTLRRIGIREDDLFTHADASFKQGSRFDGWLTGAAGEHYHHPFSVPYGWGDLDLVPAWLAHSPCTAYADLVSSQPHLCRRHLAPKQAGTPEYAAVANYGYHFDAGRFGELLRRHAVQQLGVHHIVDDVVGVQSAPNGDIESLKTQSHGLIGADLFIDCTGLRSRLIGEHFGVRLQSCRHILFNDRALATQLPYTHPDDPIASATIGTAQRIGWTWDIGLPTRRGVGLVFSSAHTSVEEAHEVLMEHIGRTTPTRSSATASSWPTPRLLQFSPGHREQFWVRNCVAVGLSAGFVEPLEATALALVEMSAQSLADGLPTARDDMESCARRFNERFTQRWSRIIDFLKLHYALSQREDSSYWMDHRRAESQSDSLKELLGLWRHRSPQPLDFPLLEEMFPAASWQYVLFGMGFRPDLSASTRRPPPESAARTGLSEVAAQTARMLRGLPTNRELLGSSARRHRTEAAALHSTA